MPIHYLFSTDLLILKIREAATFGDFFRSWKRIMSDRSFQPPIDLLVDLRQTQLDLPGHDLDKLICYWRRSPLFKKIAMVVKQDVATYSKCRTICAKCRIFLPFHPGFCGYQGSHGLVSRTELPNVSPFVRRHRNLQLCHSAAGL